MVHCTISSMNTLAKKRASLSLGLIAVASLSLTACGGPPSVSEVKADAVEHFQNAESARVDVEGTSSEELDFGFGDVTGYFEGFSETGDMRGELKSEEHGFTVEMLVVDNSTYIKGDDNFWNYFDSTGMVASTLDTSKWIDTGTVDEQDFSAFTEEFRETLESMPDEDVAVEEAELDGEEAYKYSGEDTEGEPIDLYFNTDNQVIRGESQAEGGETTMDFSAYGEVEEITAPDADEILDIPGAPGSF